MQSPGEFEVTRRDLMIGTAASVAVTTAPSLASVQASAAVGPVMPPVTSKVSFNVNGAARALELDTRTTLLDALREHLHLTGTKRAAIMASAAPAR